MARVISLKTAFRKKFTYMLLTGIWKKVLGEQTRSGAWIIYGKEKHGKTTLALMLAGFFATLEKVLYISAEEGVEDTFLNACTRAGLSENDENLHLWDYTPLEKLTERLHERKKEKIVFIDNITVYKDELKGGAMLALLKEFPDVLFIFLAHEKDGEPYTATAQACKRFAKVIFHMEGLVGKVSGRCPGGIVVVDEEKAALIHGDEINKTNIKED